ncbi:hypothetical protein Trydic_g9744 [Trypoxylus dichotomus]
MFEKIVAEQTYFLLDIKGQGFSKATTKSMIKAAVFLLLESCTGVWMTLGMCFNAEDIYTALANVTALATLNQYASLASQIITVLAFDSLFFVLLMCADSEIEQIKHGFRKLSVKDNTGENRSKVLQETATLIEHHNLVLKFPPSLAKFVRSAPYIASAIFQILIYCAIGERIAVQTEGLSGVVYTIDWPTENRPKFRKALLLVMQRAQRRSQLSAGVWYLNMSTFVSIVRGSMSMLAFMQFLYHRKQLA